jgi:stearoyl-CoA desaturase (Delta-9 desaturase)
VTRLERNVNIAAVVIPFLGVIVAGALLWNRFLGPRDLAVFAFMYALTALGVTVGFHRLLTHRAFKTRPWMRYTLAILGSMSLQGPVIDWVADHRKHHTFTDEEGDPHSPHAGHGAGLRGMVTGLWHAHVGWLFETHGQASSKRFARDLLEDPTMRRINKSFPLIALGSLAVPFLLGFALSGGSVLAGGLSALLWGGARADLPRAPHHLEHQLDLPLLRPPAVQDR